MADPIDTDAIRAHFGIPHAPQTQEMDAIDRLCAEVARLRAENAVLRAERDAALTTIRRQETP